jgi:RNA polymerase sigma-70 factor (ECF subfamily)
MPVLFRVAVRITGNEEAAEDQCHDALIKMSEKDMVFPTVNDAKYWLICVVKNASLNYAKRKGRERRAYEKALKEDRRTIDSGETALLKEDAVSRVQAALEKLPVNLRAVLQLKEYSELNYKEIGRMLGITEGNVKVRVFRAREQLSRLIGEEDVYMP